MAADNSDPQRRTYDTAMGWRAIWSPDGGRLAFVSEHDGNREVYMMLAGGSEIKRLTRDTDIDDIYW